MLFAFLLRRIDADALGRPVAQECFDITTALYYGGPLCSLADGTEEATLMAMFWDRFRQWARSHRIISEFNRENPVSGGMSNYPGQRIEQAGHVVKELDGRTEAELLGDTSKSFRRNVRKVETAGIEIIIDESGKRLDDFLGLYYDTMDRNHADARFYYPRDFFDMLNSSFAGRVAYLYALDNGRPISVELVVYCADIGYSLLGATEETSLRTGVNSFLSHKAFLYAQTRGIKHYVLGGGVTNTDDDSLLRYKLSMAKSGLRRYFTAQQVIDEERYRHLSSWRCCDTRFFPAYRDVSCCEHGETFEDSEAMR
ncbi:MAG: GNAT family N-acetyltransferase [Brevibacterium aurantiacum]|nr:GNAT family N-acetyltransferase [Brevibacterium aurantiacum]